MVTSTLINEYRKHSTNVIWRISDGRDGHDTQSKGLVKALNLIKPCDCYDIDIHDHKQGIWHLLLKKFATIAHYPNPDIIIGAGHHTHLPMLCAKRAYGGKSIVIMKPGLPVNWFDFCLIPEHDNPKIADNILTTKGAINCITPSTEHVSNRGLILIGGPSRHFYWDANHLLQQLSEILKTHIDIKWEISDSARTPEETRKALTALQEPNAKYYTYSSTGPTWLTERLGLAENVWVSMDSVSMIYESITSGATVGLLDVPARGAGKLTNNIADLVENRMATPYNKWLVSRKLGKSQALLNESRRCAEYIYEIGLLR